MKKSLTILFILLNIAIRAQENPSDKNNVNTIIGEIDKRDLKCFSDIERAKIDFKSKEVF